MERQDKLKDKNGMGGFGNRFHIVKEDIRAGGQKSLIDKLERERQEGSLEDAINRAGAQFDDAVNALGGEEA